MKKIIAILIIVTLGTSLLFGCSSSNSSDTASTTGSTTEESSAATTTENTTTSITYKTYNIMNIKYRVPDTWVYEKSDETTFFYPDKSNSLVCMEVYYLGAEKNAIYNFESAFDNLIEKLPETQGGSVSVNKKVTMVKGDFYVGKVDFTNTTYNSSTQNYIHLILDVNTGDCYAFAFQSPKKISEENTQLFNEIISSIKPNYDF